VDLGSFEGTVDSGTMVNVTVAMLLLAAGAVLVWRRR
jgi:MYXO-CTERM domain-containing protein